MADTIKIEDIEERVVLVGVSEQDGDDADDSLSELAELVKGGMLRLMLGHLSEQNNTPGIAIRTSAAELERAGLKYNSDYTLDVAPAEATVKSVIF